jgi:hypothetical protein
VNYSRNPEKTKEAEARLAAIEKIVKDDEARLMVARMNQTVATKALTDAQAAKQDTKAPAEAKATADKTVAEADQKAKQNAAVLMTFRQDVAKLRDHSKATDVKISTASDRLTLTITPAPFELRLASTNLSVRPGAKLELPIAVKRLYGFADPIQVQFLGVFNISGINAPLLTIPAGQTDGRLVIEATNSALPGSYTTNLQAGVTYHGQPVSVRQEVTLTIEAAVPAKK